MHYKSFQAHVKVLDVFPKMRLVQNTQATGTTVIVEMENVLPILIVAVLSVEDRVFSLKIPYIEDFNLKFKV